MLAHGLGAQRDEERASEIFRRLAELDGGADGASGASGEGAGGAGGDGGVGADGEQQQAQQQQAQQVVPGMVAQMGAALGHATEWLAEAMAAPWW